MPMIRSLLRTLCALSLLLPVLAQATGMGLDDARQSARSHGLLVQNLNELTEFAALSRREAVERLLQNSGRSALTPAPAWVDEPMLSRRPMRDASLEEKKAFKRERAEQAAELRAWWLREMLGTRSPLTERMTLFWHNHFVSSVQKVRSARLMYEQNVLLRAHALGNFGELLHAIAKDPAMLIYLDSASNRRDSPNENFARELMELFTLGRVTTARATFARRLGRSPVGVLSATPEHFYLDAERTTKE